MLVVAGDLTMLIYCHYIDSFPLTYILDQEQNPSFSEPTTALLLMLSRGETDHVSDICLRYSDHLLSWRVQRQSHYSKILLQFNIDE